jgi:hypothetical protein
MKVFAQSDTHRLALKIKKNLNEYLRSVWDQKLSEISENGIMTSVYCRSDGSVLTCKGNYFFVTSFCYILSVSLLVWHETGLLRSNSLLSPPPLRCGKTAKFGLNIIKKAGLKTEIQDGPNSYALSCVTSVTYRISNYGRRNKQLTHISIKLSLSKFSANLSESRKVRRVRMAVTHFYTYYKLHEQTAVRTTIEAMQKHRFSWTYSVTSE